jgi:hypothetical protein
MCSNGRFASSGRADVAEHAFSCRIQADFHVMPRPLQVALNNGASVGGWSGPTDSSREAVSDLPRRLRPVRRTTPAFVREREECDGLGRANSCRRLLLAGRRALLRIRHAGASAREHREKDSGPGREVASECWGFGQLKQHVKNNGVLTLVARPSLRPAAWDGPPCPSGKVAARLARWGLIHMLAISPRPPGLAVDGRRGVLPTGHRGS